MIKYHSKLLKILPVGVFNKRPFGLADPDQSRPALLAMIEALGVVDASEPCLFA
jgi:hypothetical protein